MRTNLRAFLPRECSIYIYNRIIRHKLKYLSCDFTSNSLKAASSIKFSCLFLQQIFPINLFCINNNSLFTNFFFKYINLFRSSDDTNNGDSLILEESVHHFTKGGACSCMYNRFVSFFFTEFCHGD